MSAEEFHKHKPRDIKPQGAGSTLDADKVDGLHASELGGGSGDMLKADYATASSTKVDTALNAEKLEGSSKAQVQDHAPKSHALDSHTGTLEDTQCEGTAGTKANTTPAAFSSWAGQPGTQRKVLVFDSVTGKPKWDYVYCYDIETPSPLPEISSFTVHTEGSYPDGSSTAMVASSGEDTPHFVLSYVGSVASCHITVSPADGDYSPFYALSSPFTSEVGPAVTRRTTVGLTIVFTATAVIDGQTKTANATLTYYNERMWGISSVTPIDTSAKIDTFRTAQSKELSNSRAKSFTVAPGAGEYIYYIYRKALGEATFTVGGFEGGFEAPLTVNYTNARGFVEDYYVYRSTQANLGSTTVVVS